MWGQKNVISTKWVQRTYRSIHIQICHVQVTLVKVAKKPVVWNTLTHFYNTTRCSQQKLLKWKGPSINFTAQFTHEMMPWKLRVRCQSALFLINPRQTVIKAIKCNCKGRVLSTLYVLKVRIANRHEHKPRNRCSAKTITASKLQVCPNFHNTYNCIELLSELVWSNS
jgi:hypothetical protein